MDRELPKKQAKKPWTTPTLRKIELTEEERGQLKASDEPMAHLLEIRRNLESGRQAASSDRIRNEWT